MSHSTHPTIYHNLSSSLQCSIKHISWRGQQNTQCLGSIGESLEIIIRLKKCTQTTKFLLWCTFSYCKTFNFQVPVYSSSLIYLLTLSLFLSVRPTEFLPAEYSGQRGIEQRMYKEQEKLKSLSQKDIYSLCVSQFFKCVQISKPAPIFWWSPTQGKHIYLV